MNNEERTFFVIIFQFLAHTVSELFIYYCDVFSDIPIQDHSKGSNNQIWWSHSVREWK